MAEKKTYTYGLSKIEVGDIAADGGMGTTLEQLGYTNEDSCTMTTEDPSDTEFNAEELDDPVLVVTKAGKTTFAFSLMNPSAEVMVKLMGGTAETDGSWKAPAKMPVIEKSVRITPTQGFTIEVPRMKLVAKINGTFSKTGMFLIDVSGTVMTPTKEGEAKLIAKLAATEGSEG